MRTLLLIAALAATVEAASVTFENDIGYRWEIGQSFDPFASAENQTGYGVGKVLYRSGFVIDNPSSWAVLLGTGAQSTEVVYRDIDQFPFYAPVTVSEPEFIVPEMEWDTVVLSASRWGEVDMWTVGGGIVGILGETYEALGFERELTSAWVELEQQPVALIEGLPVIDYQPIRWGYFTADPPPGDFNGDGLFTAADYTVWRDSDMPQSDYQIWKAAYGGVGASGSAIPEPSSVVLGLLATMLCGRRIRK